MATAARLARGRSGPSRGSEPGSPPRRLAWEQSDRDPAELYSGHPAPGRARHRRSESRTTWRRSNASSSPSRRRRPTSSSPNSAPAPTGRPAADAGQVVAIGLAITLAFAGSAGAYAITQQRRAQQAAQSARRAALAADADRLGALARSGGDYDRCAAARRPGRDAEPVTRYRERPVRHPAARRRGDPRAARTRQGDRQLAFSKDRKTILALTTPGPLVRWSAHGAWPAPTMVTVGLWRKATRGGGRSDTGGRSVLYRSPMGRRGRAGNRAPHQSRSQSQSILRAVGRAPAADGRTVVMAPSSTPAAGTPTWRCGGSGHPRVASDACASALRRSHWRSACTV